MKYDHPTIKVQSPHPGHYVIQGHSSASIMIPNVGHLAVPPVCHITPDIPGDLLLGILADRGEIEPGFDEFPLPDNKPIENPREWPDPDPEMLSSPEFEAVWQAIKGWDINVPDVYRGYSGATGNHVRAILDGLRAAGFLVKAPALHEFDEAQPAETEGGAESQSESEQPKRGRKRNAQPAETEGGAE